MSFGFAPYLLQHLKVVAAENNPATKVTPTGFLKMLLENNPSLQLPEYEKLRLSNQQGHIKNVQLKYLRRINPSNIDTTDDCVNDHIPVYAETSLTAPKFAKYSFFISDDTIARYEDEASRTVALGQPATEFMNEQLEMLMTVVQGMVGKIDTELLKAVTFGKNVSSGNSGNTATPLNILKDATQFDLTTGIGQLLSQCQENEFTGTPLIVGGGKFNAFANYLQQLGPALNGTNQAEAFRQIKYYYDQWSQASQTNGWDVDNIGVFSKGSIGFVDLDKYIGFRSGTKGISTFFRIPLPVVPAQNDGTADLMTFDAQLRYLDCPTDISDGYGDTVTVSRGWQLIISKNYGLFQIPGDAYQSGDRLYGNNGAMLFNITNS